MAKVTFNGASDVRVLAAADLAKAGVEGFTKTEFTRGVATEVPDEVAKAILDNSALFGLFSAEEAGPDPIDGTETDEKSTASKKSK